MVHLWELHRMFQRLGLAPEPSTANVRKTVGSRLAPQRLLTAGTPRVPALGTRRS